MQDFCKPCLHPKRLIENGHKVDFAATSSKYLAHKFYHSLKDLGL